VFTKIDNELKMSETDTHLFFLNGPFSQWFPSDFRGGFSGNFGRDFQFDFHCAEQYMMAGKAALFQDEETFIEILEVEQTDKWQDAPKRCKELGRKVKNFDQAVWEANARDIVYRGNLAKFEQDDDLQAFLLATGDKHLVEGAWYDAVWGVKLAWNDPKIVDPANWQGTNWLGEALMKVREEIRNGRN
jgi:hypothetical protein